MKAISSGKVTNSAAVFAGPCWYLGCGASATITVWDSPDSTLTGDIAVDYLPAAGFNPLFFPVWCSKGIYAAITGDFVIRYAL